MRIGWFFSLALLSAVTVLGYGCRAHPSTIAMTLVGDVVSDVDVELRYKKLAGASPAAADEMFGKRAVTFVDINRTDRELLLYRVPGDVLGTSRYLVEVRDGKIVAIDKKVKNKDGVEDIVKNVAWRGKFIAQDPRQCERAGKLKPPVLVLRAKETGNLVRIYDVANWTHLGGARYCVLRFDSADLCEDINLVGLAASSKKGGAIKSP